MLLEDVCIRINDDVAVALCVLWEEASHCDVPFLPQELPIAVLLQL